MEFVEEDDAHPRQGRVRLEAAGQDALGQDLDAGTGSDPALEADLIAHRLAQVLAEQGRHVRGGEASGGAAWFQHEDAPARQPVLIEEGQGDAGGFARTRGGLEQGMTGPQGGVEIIQDPGDGQGPGRDWGHAPVSRVSR